MADPTIVLASLSDDKLKESINSLVKHVNDKMEEMVESTNSAVKRMEDKLKSLGSLKIDTGGSNDGGTGRRTQQHEKLTKAVNDASEAVSKETQKLQDLQQSLSGASDREQNFISQKERAANTIAQENELLNKQQSELSGLRTQQAGVTQEVEKYAQASRNASSLRTKYEKSVSLADQLEKEYEKLKSMPDQSELLKKYNKDVEKFAADLKANLEKVRSARRESIGFGTTDNWLSIGSIDAIARHGIDKYTKDYINRLKEIARKELYSQAGDFDFKAGRTDGLKEIRQYIQDIKSTRERLQGILKSKDFEFYKPEGLKAAIQYYKDIEKEYTAIEKRLSGLHGKYQTAMSAPDNSVKIADAQIKLSQAYNDVVVNAKAVTKAEGEVFAAREKSAQASQQKAQIDAQVAAKEKEIAETKGRIATATKEQTEAEKNASQAAKEKANIQSQVANQEKQVAEAKKQLTTAAQQHTEAETKSSRAAKEKSMTLDQQASAINTAVQSEKKYTDEVLRQAAAIRSSKEWQEKGHVVIGDVNYYDKERANASKRDKQLLLSLEEQIVQAQQNEAEAARRAAQETRNQAQAQQQVQQAATGTARIIESVHEMQRRSASFSKGNASIPTFTVELEGAKRLSDRLKELREQYNNMNLGQRIGREGQAVAQQIREITRQGQKLNNELNRPTKKEVFGLSEKTLDDIAYKMRQLSAYRGGLDASKQSKEIAQVNDEYNRLKKRMDEVMQKNQQMIASNTALGRSWNYMKNRLAFYFTVGASTSFVKNLIEVRSQYEMNERALGILIDSAERGTRIFNELSKMALVSPYTLIELSTAAKQLTAYDIAAKDVVDTTRRLADMAAAVGIPIERLTYALGQIKAYGYLNARDARMFSNAGIPLVKQLADYYTELEGKMVSTADVYDRIKKKAIGMTDVMQVINKMTDEGGKFFDFQAKMAGTLKVQLANLTLAWNNMLNDIGESEQGTLSTGIKLLKDLFLRWKDIIRAVEDIAIALGVAKAAQFAYYGVVMGTNKAIAIETVLGTKLSNVLRNLGTTMSSVLTSGATWWGLIGIAAGAAIIEVIRGNEAMKEFNKTLRENAENTYNDLKKFSEQYSNIRESLYKTGNGKQTPVDIDNKEAGKVWEAMREQIELSSHASDEYIGKLLSIENISERLRQGFAVIDSIQAVSAAIKELGDDTIKLEREWSAWWNLGLLPDGTIGNLKDTHMWLSKIEEKYGSIVNARKVASTSKTEEGFDNVFQGEAKQFVENYEKELERFREDIKKTKQSVVDFIELKGWSGDTSKINEAFKIFTDNLILKNQLNPQQAFTLQLEMEEARSQAAKQALLQRINDEKAALKETRDAEQRATLTASINENVNEYNTWSDFNGRKRVEWERFTKWLKEQHISETTAMFRNMDAEDIKSLNFQEGNHADWVNRMVTQYAKEHKLSYDDAFSYLKSWVTSANQWSVFIPLIISTEDKKTVYQQLGEYDKAVDEADAKIERLTKRINELRKSKKRDKEATEELEKAEKELADAEKDKAEAEAHGGHGKKEKKDAKARAKDQKAAESELQKALKEELQLIDKVRSAYKTLTKEGVSRNEAITQSVSGYEESLKNINNVLNKYGIGNLDLTKFAGVDNPREIVNMLQTQVNNLLKSGVAKPAEVQELQVKIKDLKLDATAFDYKKLTTSLNNELGKLKDEYELAVELDASPELGSVFMDMMGISEEQLKDLPKDFSGVMTKLQGIIDDKLGNGRFDLAKNLNKTAFDSWVKANNQGTAEQDELVKQLNAIREYANKVRFDSTKKQIQEWDKLLEKYAEYETRVTKIQKEAEHEREVARRQGASQEIIDAINNREARELAKLSFEEFQRTPEWIIATGDLAGLTDSAINVLIDSIERYKKTARNLDPKQIKQINKALATLYKEQRKGNPFNVLSNYIKEAKQRAEELQPEITKTENEINSIGDAINEAIENGEDISKLKDKLSSLEERLKKLKKLQSDLSKLSPTEIVEGINAAISVAKQAAGAFTDMMDAIGGEHGSLASKRVKEVFGVLENAGSYAAMGASIGGVYGAVIGGVIGAVSGAVSTWVDEWSGNASITRAIEASERAIKRLEISYNNLEDAANNVYAAMVSGAKKALQSNKELQLAELERQLALEKSRSSKNRDEDRILELQGQIAELRNEIRNASQDIINDLLGISSAGDAIEQMVSAMVDAFRNGEDAMKAFGEKWDEMIDNMILKLIVSQYMQKAWDELMSRMQNMQEEYLNVSSDKKAAAKAEVERLAEMSDYNLAMEMFEKGLLSGIDPHTSYDDFKAWLHGSGIDTLKPQLEAYRKAAEQALTSATETLENESFDYTKWSLEYMNTEGREYMEKYAQALKDALGNWYTYGENAETNLSALQQGIQGITEDTAGALEAITNGISQQAYLQSRLITEIRDAIVGFDLDVQVATMGQMLLQLQASYQVQMSIQGILEGVLNPSGRAFNVELIS